MAKIWRRGLPIALITIVLGAACTGAEEGQDGDGQGGDGEGGQTLVVAARTTPNGLDPEFHFAEEDHQIRAAVYENLFALGTTEDENGLVVPDYASLEGRLAESWELTDGGRTLTVQLRQGVMSHAGNELTAEDVQYSWDRGWETGGSRKFYAEVVLLMSEPNWEVVDTYTWKITTPEPNAMLALLQMNNDLNIVDATEVQEHATEDDPWATEWLASNEAGHGPYMLEEWSPGTQVVLAAFEDHLLGETPQFTRIVYREVPEGSNRRALVETGEVQVAENVPPSELSSLQEAGSVTVWNTSGNRTLRFQVNHKTPPFDEPLVRKALLFATPIQDILDSVFFGFATELKSPVPSPYPGYDDSAWAYDHDPDEARRLLQQAGAEGEAFDITFDSESQVQRDTATILKTAYEDVGLTVNLKEVSSATYTTEVYEKKYEAFFLQEFPILPDPGYALALNYPCGGFLNPSDYCNEEVDSLLADGASTLDTPARMEIYAEIQRIMIAEDAVEVWVAQPGWQLVTAPGISGVEWQTPNSYPFQSLTMSG
jgi:peptide/nickel transport system substrate-binding protein